MTRRLREDDGTVLMLVLGFAIVAMLLVAVVVDISALYLARRSLAGAADSVALAGVQSLDETRLYSGGAGETLPLSASGSRVSASAHVDGAGLEQRFDNLTVAVDTSPEQTVVVLAADVRLPFAPPWLPGGVVRIDATASATSPYAD